MTPSDCDVTRYVILIVVIIAVVITFAGFMSGLENIDKTKANLLHEIDTADNTGVKNEAIKAKNALVNGGWVTDTSEVAKTCQLWMYALIASGSTLVVTLVSKP